MVCNIKCVTYWIYMRFEIVRAQRAFCVRICMCVSMCMWVYVVECVLECMCLCVNVCECVYKCWVCVCASVHVIVCVYIKVCMYLCVWTRGNTRTFTTDDSCKRFWFNKNLNLHNSFKIHNHCTVTRYIQRATKWSVKLAHIF